MTEHYQVKPWGWEDLLIECNNYRIKIIHVDKGCRTSLHYHKEKEETLWKIHQVFRPTVVFRAKNFVHIPPMKVHRLDEGDWFEVSTGPDNDSVRIEDDFGRKIG